MFLDFARDYVRRLTSAAPDTQTKYLRQLTTLNGWLTQIKRTTPTVQNLTSDDDRDWIVARRRAGASPKTIANYHGLFSAVMASAVDKELIRRNPCRGVRLPAVEDDIDNDDEKVFLTEQEFALVHATIDSRDQDFLVVAVGTGLRWGELTALKVKDLDLSSDSPNLAVRRAWKTNGSGEFALAQHGKLYLGPPWWSDQPGFDEGNEQEDNAGLGDFQRADNLEGEEVKAVTVITIHYVDEILSDLDKAGLKIEVEEAEEMS